MNRLIPLIIVMGLILTGTAYADDVYVNGYTRKDGTYVQPHIRSSPDSSRSNNYGPSTDSSQYMNPRSRDYDNDGTANYLDQDDDNDGSSDNYDSNQYGNQFGR